jgi:hypothetical protein
MIQDEWVFLDAQDREMGTIKEENIVFALVRRFIEFATFFCRSNTTPQSAGAKSRRSSKPRIRC